MKIKKILFCVMCLIMLLTPNIVLAAETFTYEGYTYSLEKVNLKMDSITEDEDFLGIDENGNYIFRNDKTNTFYKVNEKQCLVMSIEEIVKFTNTAGDKYLVLYEGYDVYEFQILYYTIGGLIKTSDTETDANKYYYDENGDWIEAPLESEIDSYYEECEFRYPISAEIDDDTTYYTKKENTNVFEKVDNPISEEINKYFIKVEQSPLIEKEIKKLDKTIFEPIFEDSRLREVYIDEETNEIRIIVLYDDGIKIYSDNGTLISEKEKDNIYEMAIYSNSLFGIIDENLALKILDKELNIVFESELNIMLREVKYDNNVYTLMGETYDDNGRVQQLEFYTMKRTKIVNNDNNQETNNPTNTPTTPDANNGEKDETPKMGSATTDNTFLFIGLIVISLVGIVNTKKYKK